MAKEKGSPGFLDAMLRAGYGQPEAPATKETPEKERPATARRDPKPQDDRAQGWVVRSVVIDEADFRKILYLSEEHGTSVSDVCRQFIRFAVAQYEEMNGGVPDREPRSRKKKRPLF